MFGKNAQLPIKTDSRMLAIHSMFYTIQGEGPYSGMPSLFIRLAGCNLACVWCDTEFEKGQDDPTPVNDLMAQVLTFPSEQRRLVVITGGEPLRQNITWFCEMLFASGTEMIQIETAGTVWQPGLERMIDSGRLVIVCSPKTPGVSPFIEKHCHHWKYVIKAGESSIDDGLPIMGTQPNNYQRPMRLYRPWGQTERPAGDRNVIWVSPCDEQDEAKNLTNRSEVVRSALVHGYRVSLQIHKLLGVE